MKIKIWVFLFGLLVTNGLFPIILNAVSQTDRSMEVTEKRVFDFSENHTFSTKEVENTQKNIEQKKSDGFRVILILITLTISLILLIKQIVFYKKYGKGKKLPPSTLPEKLWEPPSNIDPTQVEQLVSSSRNATLRSLMITILSLIQHRYCKIVRSDKKEKKMFQKEDYHYYLVFIDNNENSLSKIESFVMEFLKKMEKVTVKITGKDIECIDLNNISNQSGYHVTELKNFLTDLPKVVFNENLCQGFFNVTNRTKRINVKINTIIFIFLIFSCIFLLIPLTDSFSIVVGLISFLLIGISPIIIDFLGNFCEIRSEKGLLEAANWLAFKKHFKEYKLTKNCPVDLTVTWEKYLIYGIALGISWKTLSQIPVYLTNQNNHQILSYWGVNTLDSINNSDFDFNSIFSLINNIAMATDSMYGDAGFLISE